VAKDPKKGINIASAETALAFPSKAVPDLIVLIRKKLDFYKMKIIITPSLIL